MFARSTVKGPIPVPAAAPGLVAAGSAEAATSLAFDVSALGQGLHLE